MSGILTNAIKGSFRTVGLDAGTVFQELCAKSIELAVREQGLAEIRGQLRDIAPDLIHQYTYDLDPASYARFHEPKMRGLHAFQTRCVLDSLDLMGGTGKTIVDIGDSSGTHGRYIKALARPGQVERFISINLDPVAIEKVRASGGEAILGRGEDFEIEGAEPDLYISFETIEHLTDPVRFLHRLAESGTGENLLFTVPYQRTSRFGGHHLRWPADRIPERMTPEELHIFELSPEDWGLACKLAGFRTVFTRIYHQYPRRHPLRCLAPMWRKYDFEGFIGVFAVRDLSFAKRYTGW